MNTKTNSALKTILIAGFVAGLLDITAAMISYYLRTDQGPTRMFQGIASAAFGKEALTGGTGMAIMGLVFHFIIAYIFTIFFFIIYPKIKLYSANSIAIGLAYGICVWAVMNLVVLPLSRIPPFTIKPENARIQMGILMVCIGLPIALIVGRYYKRSYV